MEHVERLAQEASVDHKRDVGLRSTLGAGNHADTATSECAEQLSGNTRCVLHVLTHDGYGGQSAFGLHGEHGARLDFLLELLVQHLNGSLGILVAHTDTGGVLRRGLRHHEHRDAAVGQRGEDAAVHANHTHHRESRHRDERGALDARDTLDGLPVVVDLLLDERARMLGVERVLYLYGNILDADGIDGRRVDNLGAEVAQFHRLYIAQFVDGVGRLDHLRVGGHESVHVGPDFQHVGIQRGGNGGGRQVRASSSQVGRLVRVAVAGNEAGHHIHRSDGRARVEERFEGLLDQLVRQFRVEHVLALLVLRADKVAGVHPGAVLDDGGHDVRAQSLAIADDGVLRLLAQVVNQVHTVVDAPQLFEELVHIIKQIDALFGVGDDRVDHLMMAAHHCVEFLAIVLVTVFCQLRSGNQLVGDAVQGAYYYNDRLLPSLCLYNFL